jgi:large subunit ribosomal protein L21
VCAGIVPRARDQPQEKTMYAVVTTGGKQYRVEAGSELMIERLPDDAGASITFDRVLLVGDGDTITVGTPTVDGATVSATVLGEALGPKLVIFKFKQKATYRRKAGHRQHLTRVRIDEISAAGKTSRAEKTEKPAARADAPAPKAAVEAPEAEAATEAPKPKRTRKPAAAKAEAPEKADAPEKAEAPAKPAKAAPKASTKADDADADAPKPKRTRKPAAPKAKAEAEPESEE